MSMSRTQADRLAEHLNTIEPDKIRWSYVPMHLDAPAEVAWYVAKLDCLDGERLVERIS